MRIDNLRDSQAVRTRKQVKALGTRAPIGDSSITTPGKRLRVGAPGGGGYLQAGGALVWQGPVNFEGPFSNVGPFSNSGPFTNSGAFTNTGKLTQNGDADLNGAVKIAGATEITGNTELKSDLNVTGAGKIVVGNLTVDPGGAYGGRITAGGGGILHLVATTVLASDYLAAKYLNLTNDLQVNGSLTVFGAKSFGAKHPTKPGVVLRHAATESPVSGIEYWGESVIGEDGAVAVELPDYFEGLAKPDGRTIFVTGNGHSPSWTEITDGTFTVSGEPGRPFSWLVKAERYGGDFEVETVDAGDYSESNSGQ